MRPPVFILVLICGIVLSVDLSLADKRTATPTQSAPKAIAMPRADSAHKLTYGFASSDQIAVEMNAGQPASAATSSASGSSSGSSGGGSTVTVTATVLPIRIIVVDGGGAVTQIWSNAGDRRLADSLYQVRRGSSEGELVPLSAEIWDSAAPNLTAEPDSTGRVL